MKFQLVGLFVCFQYWIYIDMKERQIRQSYVETGLQQQGFHSQRHETSQGMSDSHEALEMRALVREYHIKYPVQTLLTHFKTIFNQKGFKTTEVFPGKIMLVRLGLLDRLRFIVSSKEPPRYLLVVKTQQYKSVRKVSIRKLKTHPNIAFQNENKEIRQLLKWIDHNHQRIPELKKDSTSTEELEVGSEYQQDMYSLEATSTYMYHKIFVDHNYSMGKKMRKLLQDSKDTLEESATSEAKLIIGGLKEITQDMLEGFNCTRKELLQILCHCRKTVEDYYHDRKFLLHDPEKLEMDRGSIQVQIQEKLPQTVKSFHRLMAESNSTKILRQIFLVNFVFEIESGTLNIGEPEQKILAKKLGAAFGKQLLGKTRVLDLWGYSPHSYNQHLQRFIS